MFRLMPSVLSMAGTIGALADFKVSALAAPLSHIDRPYNYRAPGAVGAHKRAAAKVRNRRRHKRACGMRGRSR